jgi:hypothetical protein
VNSIFVVESFFSATNRIDFSMHSLPFVGRNSTFFRTQIYKTISLILNFFPSLDN